MSFDNTPFSIWEENYRPKINFAKQDVNAKSIDVYSEKESKMIPIRETNIKLLLLMELEKGRNEVRRLVRYEECIVNNCPEEDLPPMPLPIRPDYTKTMERRVEMAKKGILSPSCNRENVNRPFIQSIRKFHHAHSHQCRTLNLGRWGKTRPRMRLLKNRQMDGKGNS